MPLEFFDVRLILASASPRRAALLREAGYEFVVESAAVDEDRHLGKFPPAELAAFLADAKAREVAARFPGDVVLAADTVVAFGGAALGKPADADAAREMIRLLAGTVHEVVTGVAVCAPGGGGLLHGIEVSRVQMRPFTPAQVEAYVASELWRGKAGGYGIQDPDSPVTCLSGSVSNVMGLPMNLTRRLLGRAGIGRGGTADGRGWTRIRGNDWFDLRPSAFIGGYINSAVRRSEIAIAPGWLNAVPFDVAGTRRRAGRRVIRGVLASSLRRCTSVSRPRFSAGRSWR